MVSTAATDALGYVGASVLASAAPIQFFNCVRTRSANSISFLWLFVFLCGLTLLITYALLADLTPVWAPLIVEIAFTVGTILLKAKVRSRRQERTQGEARKRWASLFANTIPTS